MQYFETFRKLHAKNYDFNILICIYLLNNKFKKKKQHNKIKKNYKNIRKIYNKINKISINSS